MPRRVRQVFVYNKTKETFLAFRVNVADSILSRLVGLLGLDGDVGGVEGENGFAVGVEDIVGDLDVGLRAGGAGLEADGGLDVVGVAEVVVEEVAVDDDVLKRAAAHATVGVNRAARRVARVVIVPEDVVLDQRGGCRAVVREVQAAHVVLNDVVDDVRAGDVGIDNDCGAGHAAGTGLSLHHEAVERAVVAHDSDGETRGSAGRDAGDDGLRGSGGGSARVASRVDARLRAAKCDPVVERNLLDVRSRIDIDGGVGGGGVDRGLDGRETRGIADDMRGKQPPHFERFQPVLNLLPRRTRCAVISRSSIAS